MKMQSEAPDQSAASGKRWLAGAWAWACALAGVLLHAYTLIAYPAPGYAAFLVGLFIWSCAPYAVALVVVPKLVSKIGAACFATACLLADFYFHWSVFLHPRSSTASLALLVAPLWNVAVFGPLGAGLGWLLGRFFFRRSPE